jgi:hypothetical protein
MTTQTHTLPELDPALDFEVPCDKDERAAAWLGIMPCCGANGLLCVPCAVKSRMDIAHLFATCAVVLCADCRHAIPSPADIRWEPIR